MPLKSPKVVPNILMETFKSPTTETHSNGMMLYHGYVGCCIPMVDFPFQLPLQLSRVENAHCKMDLVACSLGQLVVLNFEIFE